ncbi:hypothetical protein GE061_017342 [Apolygus lucorum]|nr:hypothetical protein GE061_017342 [Apolygus lucorum]
MEHVPVGQRTNYKDFELEIRSRMRREWSVNYESGAGAGNQGYLVDGFYLTSEVLYNYLWNRFQRKRNFLPSPLTCSQTHCRTPLDLVRVRPI